MTIGGRGPRQGITTRPHPRRKCGFPVPLGRGPAPPPDEKWPPPLMPPRAYTALEPRVTLAAATLAAAARVRISWRDMVVLRGFCFQGPAVRPMLIGRLARRKVHWGGGPD